MPWRCHAGSTRTLAISARCCPFDWPARWTCAVPTTVPPTVATTTRASARGRRAQYASASFGSSGARKPTAAPSPTTRTRIETSDALVTSSNARISRTWISGTVMRSPPSVGVEQNPGERPHCLLEEPNHVDVGSDPESCGDHQTAENPHEPPTKFRQERPLVHHGPR